MSVNEKTGLPDFDGDVHNNEIYWDEEPDPENDIPREIVAVETSPFLSDEEYEHEFNNADKDNQEKHWVRIEDIDSEPSERSKWVSNLIKLLKAKWPESFDNIGFLRTSIVVSLTQTGSRDMIDFNWTKS